ncbi:MULTISPECIES: hypothetical protein [Prochlorococcus]|uniref:Uncharacterized protein n=1 Tax=Prochlorococcus marinus (strain SARG / CCMP1375 / SS120) TaxID=167539 RepID=Q7VBD3_PROMA|nr:MULTISPECIES: hypothetical protein [Prochlorococcus]AAQ00207.1 Predicted protein [Prochlorococcus marinus subsp. marinus str. CCMP1375]KGG14007.1 hypothetical protein EV04_0492 [Prochlorococcus marinus str. LG]KGG19139.1 hypothetical protein EV08_1626 [Prochlorococcus marinus str. SS2]KGG23320.1 hypothetical protein EV09_0944 [Prochlorococcus marinus str. SS35]KGG32445.1 hypothetical protein EV10_1560 [Prochlorococcus marinus str. SS51]
MNKQLDSIIPNQSDEFETSGFQHSFVIGSALVVLNLVLMSCIGIYWTNTAVHQYFSGSPL